MTIDRAIRILHLEDDPADAELIRETILQQDVRCEIEPVSSKTDFETAFDPGIYDLILCDFGIPGYSGMDALAHVRKSDPDLPFILLSGSLGEEQAVESLKLGANDYILKNRVFRLGPAIVRAVHEYDEKLSRRRADQALRLNEERLSCVLRASNDAVWDWDMVKRSVWWNQGLQALFGYAPTPQCNYEWWEASVHPDDRQRVVLSLHSTLTGKHQTWGQEYRFRCKDGSYAFVFDRGYIMRDEHGKACRMIGSMMDISERKKSEQEIRRQAQLLDQTHDAIFVRDIEQHIVYWNAGAERLYGWTAEEAIGRNADALLSKNPTQSNELQEVARQGEWTGELNHVTKAGREVIVNSRCTLMRDPEGNPIGILSINSDITEKKKLELQFLQAQRLECVGSLAGGIAHDLNNMLAPILMAADMLRDSIKSSDDDKMIDLIMTSATRGADLIKQILAFSKGAETVGAVFSVRHVILDVEKVLRATLPREIHIESECPADLRNVRADATQVHQVLMNLCINARDAMPNGGKLRISCGNGHPADPTQNGFVWITVKDTGTGIPEPILARIFDPFFTTKEPGKGTGLGLATVKKIITSHGGQIEVASKPGEGTAFTFCLPSSAGADQLADSRPADLPRGRGEKVLVVDDEAALREILKTTLESFGYSVQTVPNGLEALKALRTSSFEILLTDLNMPGMGGPELVKEAIALKDTLIFVLMTGVLDRDSLSKLQHRAKVILQKPFTTGTLLNALREASDRRAA